MPQRSIVWSQRLHDATKVLAAEPPPDAAPSVKERAQEAIDFCRPGLKLEPWRVEIIQCLRTRLEPYRIASHKAFHDAFAEAWDAGS